MTFYRRNDKEQDLYIVPPGKQYEKVADTMLRQIAELDALPFEQVYITSRDGLRLAGRYYRFHENAPVQIQFHGYRGNAVRDYAGAYQLAVKLGYNVLVVDERAHGKSEGHTITFGIKERFDCLDWVRYVNDRFGEATPIILSGVSMGAATVLMASELDLPANVVGITADCPYSTPGRIIRKICRDVKLPSFLVYPFVVLGALVYGRFRIWESSAVKAVQHTKIPIQIIHGEDDRFVPCEMSRQIQAACAGPCKLETFPDAGHCLCYLADTDRYERLIKGFLKDCGIGK